MAADEAYDQMIYYDKSSCMHAPKANQVPILWPHLPHPVQNRQTTYEHLYIYMTKEKYIVIIIYEHIAFP